MSTELHDAIDSHLARAETKLDALIRDFGGTPTPSAAQIARAMRSWTAMGTAMNKAFANIALNAGAALTAWGEALTTPPTQHKNLPALAGAPVEKEEIER